MEQSELLVGILHAEPVDEIEGRTTIQKLAYFSSVKTRIDMGFGPHYYGPYSPLVASYLEDLVALDFIVEKGRRTVRDRTMYSYALTKDGEKLAKKIEKTYPKEYRTVKTIVNRCYRVVHNNISVLSWAAKVHYLLHQAGKPMTNEEAISTGRLFGWKLSEKGIESAVKLLLALQLIKRR